MTLSPCCCWFGWPNWSYVVLRVFPVVYRTCLHHKSTFSTYLRVTNYKMAQLVTVCKRTNTSSDAQLSLKRSFPPQLTHGPFSSSMRLNSKLRSTFCSTQAFSTSTSILNKVCSIIDRRGLDHM